MQSSSEFSITITMESQVENKNDDQQVIGNLQEELSESDKTFVKQFKQRRELLGFSEVDVALALLYSEPRSLYGNFYNPATISKFENQQLSVSNILKLIPVLQKWLEKTETDQNVKLDNTQSNQIIKRKKVHFNIPENQTKKAGNQNENQTIISSVQEEIFPLVRSNPNANLTFISTVREELSESDKNFVEQFKQRRKKLGYSQSDVGLALGSLCGKIYSSKIISSFENLQLPASRIHKLIPILQKWLEKQASISPAGEELSESDKTFAEQFKQRRMQLGFTQTDVGLALGSLYGNFYTGGWISQFENLKLPVSNIHKLKPILQKWLEDTRSDQPRKRKITQSNQNMKRKKTQSKNLDNPAEEHVRSLQEEISPTKKRNLNSDLTFNSSAKEELSESDRNFAQKFKQRRKQLGFTQTEVGFALGSLYGNYYTGDWISKYENLQLSVSNTKKLRPIFQKWLEKTESDQNVE